MIFFPRECEWNFDEVPDNEIIACCLWEYARESPSIGLAAELYWCHVRHISNREKYEQDPSAKLKDDAEAKRIERRARDLKFNYSRFSDKFWKTDAALVDFYETIREYACDGCFPWRKLPPRVRKIWSRQVSQSRLLHPLSIAMVGEVEQLWNANRKEVDAIRARPRPEYDDSEDGALYAESSAVPPSTDGSDPPLGKLIVAFTADFSRFSDQEMVTEFKLWLKQNRPRRWKRPSCIMPGLRRRGHKLIEYRVALERLGLMRLLHNLTPKEMRYYMPKAWAKYARKKPEFRRELQAACKSFSKFFPFIPKSERPSSSPRKGVWVPEIMAILDEVDREMESKGGD